MSAKKDFNKNNRQGINAIFKAIEKGNLARLQDMVARGADIDTCTTTQSSFSKLMAEVPYAVGSTPLHAAAMHGEAEIVAYLLEQGADPNARNSDHETPVDCAVSSHAYYQAQLEAKKSPRFFVLKSSVRKVNDKISLYEDIIGKLLKAGGNTGHYRLPEHFTRNTPPAGV